MPRMQQQTIDPRLIPTVRSSYNHAARRPHDQTRLQPQTLSLMPVTSVETKSSSFSSQTPSQLLIKDRIQSEEPLDGSSQDPDLLSLSVENTQVPEDIKSHAPLDQVQQWFDLVNNEVEPLSATQQPELQADPTEQPDRADRIEVTANVADEYEAHAEGDLSPRSPFS